MSPSAPLQARATEEVVRCPGDDWNTMGIHPRTHGEFSGATASSAIGLGHESACECHILWRAAG
jgi:hypothetical protein